MAFLFIGIKNESKEIFQREFGPHLTEKNVKKWEMTKRRSSEVFEDMKFFLKI